ncbi:PREDICTED: coiled-coil domain-containing protein 174 [Ceratosolen solmsi marchali]|uniref:Coiled-coil domain-containing protein 174 n=1 Tax=Ceratosolen solmsi marchali TaxID=326594 RepID=A0AAJ6YHN8_9HYME|nr:PREDICTED: coiled-coil domain-containing protein 174 [Ceratosolen solmsi marchali]
MNAESKINVHYSSLVGLKAELLRKQSEVEAAKKGFENIKLISKAKIKDKASNEKRKARKFEDNEETEEAEDSEDAKTLQKSKLMLQAKSRLYDTLSKTHTNLNPNFLVDFQNKSDDTNYLETERKTLDNDCKSDYDSDGEWVEYTDCFGRTRKCLPEDLPKMQEKDDFIRKKINDKPQEETGRSMYIDDKLPNKEPELEMMRKKWEEQTEKLSNKVNIHYEDVLFDEARTHGVGYYAFSQDEEERAKQQENLSKLRKETEEKQQENQEIRNIKDKLQQNRLRAARLRQRMRLGLSDKEAEEEILLKKSEQNKIENIEINIENENQNEQSNEISNCVQNNEINSGVQTNEISSCNQSNETHNNEQKMKQEIAKSNLADIENKIEAFGQLLGKRNRWYVMSQEEWVHKKRKERTKEFGPIYNNFESKKSPDLTEGANQTSDFADSKNSNDTLDNESSTVESIPPHVGDFCVDRVSLVKDDTPSVEPIFQQSTITKETSSQSPKDTKVYENIACQVEAGLKYLRHQFEKKRS